MLRLVDCSLVLPPRPGPDQRMRYALLQTLRAFGLARLEEAGEERETAAALAGFALSAAERAAAGLVTANRELQAVRWLDAEDATLDQATNWALEHDRETALRLAATLAPWWRLRGRIVEGYRCLAAAAEQPSPASRAWAGAQLWLGHLSQIANPAASLAHYTAAEESGDAQESADALVGRSVRNINYGQISDAAEDARRALALARDAGYRAGEAQALTVLCYIAHNTDARAKALDWGRQAEASLGAGIPGWVDRWCRIALALVLTESGELDSARRVFGDSLARSREAGDLADLPNRLMALARLERLSGNKEDARAYLHEAVEVASRIGDHGPAQLPYGVRLPLRRRGALGRGGDAAGCLRGRPGPGRTPRSDRSRPRGAHAPGGPPAHRRPGPRGRRARCPDDAGRRRRVRHHADDTPGKRGAAGRRRADRTGTKPGHRGRRPGAGTARRPGIRRPATWRGTPSCSPMPCRPTWWTRPGREPRHRRGTRPRPPRRAGNAGETGRGQRCAQ